VFRPEGWLHYPTVEQGRSAYLQAFFVELVLVRLQERYATLLAARTEAKVQVVKLVRSAGTVQYDTEKELREVPGS
jgi:hypothetical protein